jgi:hypothetical protein
MAQRLSWTFLERIQRRCAPIVWGRAPSPVRAERSSAVANGHNDSGFAKDSAQAPRPAHAFFFACGHTIVTTSATPIPSDTSRNRCHPVIQGARVRGISKIMLRVTAANR